MIIIFAVIYDFSIKMHVEEIKMDRFETSSIVFRVAAGVSGAIFGGARAGVREAGRRCSTNAVKH